MDSFSPVILRFAPDDNAGRSPPATKVSATNIFPRPKWIAHTLGRFSGKCPLIDVFLSTP